MSFFIIRLLQNFSSVSLDLTAQPPDTLPPSEWKDAPGRKGKEQIFPKSHLTLYSFVSLFLAKHECKCSRRPFVQGGMWVKMEEADPVA